MTIAAWLDLGGPWPGLMFPFTHFPPPQFRDFVYSAMCQTKYIKYDMGKHIASGEYLAMLLSDVNYSHIFVITFGRLFGKVHNVPAWLLNPRYLKCFFWGGGGGWGWRGGFKLICMDNLLSSFFLRVMRKMSFQMNSTDPRRTVSMWSNKLYI